MILLFPLIIIFILILFWSLWFCRQPARKVPRDEKAIVSPANGTVAVVRRFNTTQVRVKKWNHGSVEVLARDVAKKGWFILIVMTPLNVHYQRSPVDGKVVKTRATPGTFHNAVRHPEKLLTLENEKNEILIATRARKRVKVVQIAGVLARRIRCDVAKDEEVKKGEIIGFINLGSQVALLLPEKVTISVQPGERVVDGETIIATWQ